MTSPDPDPIAPVLHQACRQAGARWADDQGAILDFGDVGEEYRALGLACGVELLPGREVLELRGADRERFLNGMVTCQVQGLEAGQGRYGFFTGVQGKILSDAVILALGDRFRVELAAGYAERIRDHLAKYIIADRVELAVEPGPARLRLAGPEARSVVEALLGRGRTPVAEWRHGQAELGSGSCRVVQHGGWPGPLFELACGAEALVEVIQRVAAGRLGAARLVGNQAVDAVRVEDGVAVFGREFGSDHFPQETGREDAVSYDKGCYLGQEVVARIHYRGKVNRVLRGVLLEGEDAPQIPEPLLSEGREVGRLTTVAYSPRAAGLAGLALIHRQAAAPGTEVELARGGRGRIAELPLAAAD